LNDLTLWQQWDEHYDRIGSDKDKICRDGIIDEDEFGKDGSKKILFVMKDDHDNKAELKDLRETLKDGPRNKMWQTAASWAVGILNDFPLFKKIEFEMMRSAIRQIAAVNLKKVRGTKETEMFELNASAFQDRALLRKQIDLINPEIIIACGTFDLLVWLLELDVKPDSIDQPVYYKDKIRVIRFWHPDARKSDEKLYKDMKKVFEKS